jgi:small neutral amino acid transporter SnatA (MarC family)
VSEFGRAVLGMFAAVAPFGALPVFLDARVGAEQRRRVVALMYVAALLVLGAGVLVAEPFLDWLDVQPENFQLAAGLIMLPQALQLVWRGRTLSGAEAGTIVPLAAPLLAGPASLAAAMSYGTRFGEMEAAGASGLVLFGAGGLLLAGEWVERRAGRAAIGLLGRLNGALLVIIAIEMAVDGVRSV